MCACQVTHQRDLINPMKLWPAHTQTHKFVSLLPFSVVGTKRGAYPCICHNTKFPEENHSLSIVRAFAERPDAIHRHPHAVTQSLGELLKLFPSVECAFLVMTLATTSDLAYLSNISRIIPLSTGPFVVFAKSSTCWAALGISDSKEFAFEVQDV